MINKLYTPILSFVCVAGGLVLLFTQRADLTVVSCMFIIYLCAVTLGFYAYKQLRPLKITKVAVSVWSLVSCAFSVTVSAGLITKSSVLDGGYYPFLVVLTAVFAAVLASSSDNSLKSTILVCTLFSVIFIVMIVILSMLDTDFSMPSVATFDFKSAIPSAFASILDVFLIFGITKHKTPAPYLAGGTLAFLSMLIIIFVSISVLSPQVWYSLEAPLLKLWQSTYIASFVNRFEIVAVSALYLITALKAGLVLRPSLKYAGENLRFLLVILVFLLCIPFSFL